MNARPWMLAIAIILSVGLSYGQSGPDNARIESLVKKLGHASFIQRETARKELEAIGVPALEPLRRASKTADPETSRRIGDLIRLFEERIVTQQVLAPKEVHLKFNGATVPQAIGELASVSGYPLQFVGDATRVNDKKITLDTGKIPFWQAVDRLCAEAGLMEKIEIETPNRPPTFNPGVRRRIYYPPAKQAAPNIIYLTPRGNEKSLVSHAGSVRTELRIARDEKAKELTLTFLVSIEPKLLNSGVVGRPVIDKLIDQAGRSLTIAPDVARPEPKNPDMDMMIDLGDTQVLPSRSTQVRVKDGPDAAKLLKEIVGNLAVQVDLQNEQIVKIPDIMKSAGKTTQGHNGGSLKVSDVKKQPNGDVEIQLSMENLTPDPFGGAVIVNGNNIIIRGNVNIKGGMVIGPNGVRLNGSGSLNDLPSLIDAKGQKFKVSSTNSDSTNFTNGTVSRSATIVYQPHPDQAEPRELILFGTRTHTVAVPFRFEAVTLP